MGILSQQLAGRIWNAHRELNAAKKCLEELQEQLKTSEPEISRWAKTDSFSRTGIEIGIPSSESSKRMYSVGPELAVSVVRAHIADQEALLVRLSEEARIELRNEQN